MNTMEQHFVDMDKHRHNPFLLVTNAINSCVGICVFYDGGVFLLHASPAFGLPDTLKTTTKVNVQKFLQNVAAAAYELIVDIGRVRAVCIVGGKNEQNYRQMNTFIKELQNERKNIKIIENETLGTIVEVKFHLTDKHLEEFLGAIIYSNTQANIGNGYKCRSDNTSLSSLSDCDVNRITHRSFSSLLDTSSSENETSSSSTIKTGKTSVSSKSHSIKAVSRQLSSLSGDGGGGKSMNTKSTNDSSARTLSKNKESSSLTMAKQRRDTSSSSTDSTSTTKTKDKIK
ncbi:unnamed protein product [Rotaria sp. Silwood1]|nr:unnamed protein product [Rotaria sp. Silwood1]CAF1053832.1 unnamed protein product [Rotaria sp. Silwood1]CAF1159136.1 unnamed protein product [Rotaria sp. Silwood1]